MIKNTLLQSFDTLRKLSTDEPQQPSDYLELATFLRKDRVFVSFRHVFELVLERASKEMLPEDSVPGFVLYFQDLDPPTNPLATLHACAEHRYSLQLPQAPLPTVDQLFHNDWHLTATRSGCEQGYDARDGFDNAKIVPEVIKMAATDLLAVATETLNHRR